MLMLSAACDKARFAKDVFGNVMELAQERAADRDKMLGQGTAEDKIVAAAFLPSVRSNRLV